MLVPEKESIIFHNQLVGLFKSLIKTLPETKPYIKEALQYYRTQELADYLKELGNNLTPHINSINSYDEHIFSTDYLNYRSLDKLILIPKIDFRIVWQKLYESEDQFENQLSFKNTKESIFKYLRSIYIAYNLATKEQNYNDKLNQFKDDLLKNLTSDLKVDPEMEKRIEELAKEGKVMGISDLFNQLFNEEFLDDCFQKLETQLEFECPNTKSLIKLFMKRLGNHPDFSKNPMKVFRMITDNNERKVLIELCKEIITTLKTEITMDDIKKEMDQALAIVNKKAEESAENNPQLAELLKTARNSTKNGDPEQIFNKLKEILKTQSQSGDGNGSGDVNVDGNGKGEGNEDGDGKGEGE